MGYKVSLPPSMGEGMSSKSIVRIHINITHEKKNNEFGFWFNFSFLNIK